MGRSTSLAEVTAEEAVPAGVPGQVVCEAADPGDTRAAFQVRVPYSGYMDELDAAYLDGRRSWETARTVPYTVRGGLGVRRQGRLGADRASAGTIREPDGLDAGMADSAN